MEKQSKPVWFEIWCDIPDWVDPHDTLIFVNNGKHYKYVKEHVIDKLTGESE